MADFWIRQGWYETMPDGSKKLTKGKWKGNPEACRAATRFLVDNVLGKPLCEITKHDFGSNGLWRVINGYHGEPYRALRDAGYKINPWEMRSTPNGFFASERNRIRTIKWIVKTERIHPTELSKEHFRRHHLSGLLTDHYRDAPYEAVRAAYAGILPGDMDRTPTRHYDSRNIRVAEIRAFAKKLGKPAKDVTAEDFKVHGLGGLLTHHYAGRPFLALLDAKLVTRNDETYMCHHGPRHA